MSDGQARGYIPGDYYIICDETGFKIRRSEAKQTWDGLLVKINQWARRHPQDFVRGVKDKISVAPGQTRGENTDGFLTDNEVQAGDL